MKKILLIVALPLLLAATGYFGGRLYFKPEKPAQTESAENTQTQEILYRLPLGKFTIQVLQPGRILHILINVDIFLAGASEFDRLNGAEGRTRIRDATISAISDLAETKLWIQEGDEDQLDKDELAVDIALMLHRQFAAVRTARVNELHTTRSVHR